MKEKPSEQFELMKNGKPFFYDDYINKIQINCSKLLKKLDNAHYGSSNRDKLFKKLFKQIGQNNIIKEGFKCNLGSNISIGNNCFFNFNVTILDSFEVKIGNNVWIAPNVVISPVTHSLDANKRRLQEGGKIVIEDDVWIGAGAIIFPNIHLGKGSVVGAGAVVTKDVAPHTIVVGIPAKEKSK